MNEDPLLGRQLDEYYLEELLGQGGMARVYRALDTRLRRYVAVKVIDVPFRGEADYVERFEREARAIAHLSHPHIVGLHRYGEADGLLYMAMQYVPGSDLQRRLQTREAEGTRMPPAEIVALAGQIGSALDYAHAQGVIHRDVKPSNILLTPEGNAVLTDFGLVLLEAVGTRGEVLGTPHYLAPEQALSSAGALAQSDLYSLGIILYRAFAGCLPFDGDDALAIAMQQLTEQPPAPRTYRPDLDPAVEAMILKALAKEPDDRYQSGSTLATALAEALELNGGHLLRQDALGPGRGIAREESALALPAAGPEEAVRTGAPAAGIASQPALRWYWPLLAGGLFLLFCLLLAGLLPAGPLRGRGQEESVTGARLEEWARLSTPQPPEGSVATKSLVQETVTVPPTGTGGNVAVLASPVPAPLHLPLFFKSEAAAREGASQPPAPGRTATLRLRAIPTTTPTPTPAVAATPQASRLLLIRSGDNLFLVNGDEASIPLNQVALIMSGRDRLDTWPVHTLQSGSCVRIQKDKRTERPLPDPCRAAAGEPLIFRWKDNFSVTYGAEEIARCRLRRELERCVVTLPGQ